MATKFHFAPQGGVDGQHTTFDSREDLVDHLFGIHDLKSPLFFEPLSERSDIIWLTEEAAKTLDFEKCLGLEVRR